MLPTGLNVANFKHSPVRWHDKNDAADVIAIRFNYDGIEIITELEGGGISRRYVHNAGTDRFWCCLG